MHNPADRRQRQDTDRDSGNEIRDVDDRSGIEVAENLAARKDEPHRRRGGHTIREQRRASRTGKSSWHTLYVSILRRDCGGKPRRLHLPLAPLSSSPTTQAPPRKLCARSGGKTRDEISARVTAVCPQSAVDIVAQ